MYVFAQQEDVARRVQDSICEEVLRRRSRVHIRSTVVVIGSLLFSVLEEGEVRGGLGGDRGLVRL